jgi:hypothetical protein
MRFQRSKAQPKERLSLVANSRKIVDSRPNYAQAA